MDREEFYENSKSISCIDRGLSKRPCIEVYFTCMCVHMCIYDCQKARRTDWVEILERKGKDVRRWHRLRGRRQRQRGKQKVEQAIMQVQIIWNDHDLSTTIWDADWYMRSRQTYMRHYKNYTLCVQTDWVTR